MSRSCCKRGRGVVGDQCLQRGKRGIADRAGDLGAAEKDEGAMGVAPVAPPQ
jgi:hypothetical protein